MDTQKPYSFVFNNKIIIHGAVIPKEIPMTEDDYVKEVVDSFCTLKLIEKMSEYMRYFGKLRVSSFASSEEHMLARKKQSDMLMPIAKLLEDDLIKKGIKKETLKSLIVEHNTSSFIINTADQLMQICKQELTNNNCQDIQYLMDTVYSLLYFIVHGEAW